MRSKIHIQGNQPVKHQFDKLAKTVLVTVMVFCEKKLENSAMQTIEKTK